MMHSTTTRPEALPTDLATGYRSWFGFPLPYRQWYAHASLPSGDLIANAEEITHYLIAQLNEGRYGDVAILSPQGMATLHQPAVREGESEKFYAMGWEVRPMNDLTVVRHDGTSANYYADVVLEPTSRWGIVILLNLNSFHFYGGRLHALSGGVLSLLSGQTLPTLSAMHHPILFPLLLVILSVTGLLLLWWLRLAQRWRRWRNEPVPTPQAWRRLATSVLPLILPLGWALLLLVGVPNALYPLAVLLINIPDFAYTLLDSGVLALAWSVVWSALLIFRQRTADQRAKAGSVASAHTA